MNDEVQRKLREARDEVLLKTFAALTHRLHVADRTKGPDAAVHALDLREQRHHVENEILRRMQS